MSAAKLAALGLVMMIAVGCGAPAPAPEPEPAADAAPEPPQFAVTGEHPCDPVGDIRFICDMVSPEDIVVIPGAEWAIVSGAREGGRLQLLNVSDKTATVLFPTPDSEQRHDAEAYPECPGPFDLANPDVSRLHGLYLEPGSDSVHTLLVVHHGPREAIEFFEVDAGDAPPSLAWIGCAVAPEGANLNSVVALPGGGFATTNAGIGVWEWHADSGWEVLPESEDTAPNGIEVSEDGQTLYHRRLGRGEADAPVARRHAGAEGRHPARLPPRQPAHGARRLGHLCRRSPPTGTATRSPFRGSRRWRRPTWRRSIRRPWSWSECSCTPP